MSFTRGGIDRATPLREQVIYTSHSCIMNIRCVRCYVSGKVQGVFYRASTREQAIQLGLRGYATNLSDGRVEVVACGSEVAVDSLIAWLREGPPQAWVTELEVESTTDPGMRDFDIN